MNIENTDFEKPLYICIAGQTIEVSCFKTDEPGNIKFGVKAPRNIPVNREEVAIQKKLKNVNRN